MSSTAAITAYKAKAEAANTSARSEDTTSFPLYAYLELIERADNAAFTNYCEGAALLYKWLTYDQLPMTMPDISLIPSVPKLACGYESQIIAQIIAGPRERYDTFSNYLSAITQIRKAIYHCAMTTRIPIHE